MSSQMKVFFVGPGKTISEFAYNLLLLCYYELHWYATPTKGGNIWHWQWATNYVQWQKFITHTEGTESEETPCKTCPHMSDNVLKGWIPPPDNRNAIHPKEGPFFSGPDGCSATLWWACVCQSVRTSPVLIDVLFRVAYPSYICMYVPSFCFPRLIAWEL